MFLTHFRPVHGCPPFFGDLIGTINVASMFRISLPDPHGCTSGRWRMTLPPQSLCDYAMRRVRRYHDLCRLMDSFSACYIIERNWKVNASHKLLDASMTRERRKQALATNHGRFPRSPNQKTKTAPAPVTHVALCHFPFALLHYLIPASFEFPHSTLDTSKAPSYLSRPHRQFCHSCGFT